MLCFLIIIKIIGQFILSKFVNHADKFLTQAERVFGIAMLMILLSFFIIAKKTSNRSLEILNQTSELPSIPLIQVEIAGAVHKPGIFQIPQGASIRSVLRKARVKPLADLSNIHLDEGIHASTTIQIPTLKTIQIEICGCVKKNVCLEMPAGSRICDLKNRILVTSDADLSFFRRRKLLINHEIVQIPSKYEKTNIDN